MSAPRAAASGVRDLARDVQRFGLLSASSVVDRYIDLVDRAVGGGPAAPSPHPSDRPSEQAGDGDMSALVASAARLAEAYLDVLEAAAQTTETSAATEVLTLDAGRPGEMLQSPLWVHNPGLEPSSAMTLTVGPLVASGGATLDATSVACVPGDVRSIGPRESVRLEVTVAVPSDQQPGVYHGFVVSSLAPSVPMRVTVEVLPA